MRATAEQKCRKLGAALQKFEKLGPWQFVRSILEVCSWQNAWRSMSLVATKFISSWYTVSALLATQNEVYEPGRAREGRAGREGWIATPKADRNAFNFRALTSLWRLFPRHVCFGLFTSSVEGAWAFEIKMLLNSSCKSQKRPNSFVWIQIYSCFFWKSLPVQNSLVKNHWWFSKKSSWRNLNR